MKILYIPIGSFCYSKIIIRETDRNVEESLPFDFHSTPHMSSISRIFQELYETQNYNIEYKNILSKHEEEQLVVAEKNNMYIVHYFYEQDLKNKNVEYPCPVENLYENKRKEIKEKLERRFKRLLKYLHKKEDIICFLRIENYENHSWHEELTELTSILKKFNVQNNKYLIYSNPMVDEKLDFRVMSRFSYAYDIPIFFYKELFTDMIIIHHKDLFIGMLEHFESIMNHPNVIDIERLDKVEKYYLDREKKQIFKLCNLDLFSFFYIDNDLLYINTAIHGYETYLYNHEKKRYMYTPSI